MAPSAAAAVIPPMVALSGPHPSAATISGNGARKNSSSEISAPEMIEANIKADAEPAAMAIRTIAIISCPAAFERLEVCENPNHRQPDDPGSLMKILTGGTHAADREFLLEHDLIRKTGTHFSGSCCLPDHVRQQAEETRALDGAREFTLLLGGDGGDAARHDLSPLPDVKHPQP